MSFETISERGLVILGCGKMGGAILQGLMKRGLSAQSVWVVDPRPAGWLKEAGVHLNTDLPTAPSAVLVAVKPQMMQEALPGLRAMGSGHTLFLTVAAGITIANYETVLGASTPLVRAMPNMPAAIGRAITAIIGNRATSPGDLGTAETLLQAVGQVVHLEREEQMDAVTAVSGSGPAYVFHLIETLAAAGEAQGLSPDLAMKLARATVGGAGQLAEDAAEDASQLRVNVTSPGGTTAAALNVLMDEEAGFPALLRRAVKAATDRGRELGQ